MGYKYTGDSVLGVSLTIDTPKPLDSRTVVDRMSQLYDIPENTAYQGMTVANIADGNIYMLVDKAKINEKAGWKASYESIQIIACNESEYKLWEQNTNEDYTPKDETLTYLHPDTYYYIYEDSINNIEGQAYVSYSQLAALEESVRTKASESSVTTVSTRITNLQTTLETDYSTTVKTKEYVESLLNTEDSESTISKILDNYYDKDTANSTFVTTESLKDPENKTDYIFVSKTEYNTRQDEINDILESTLKTEEDGSVKTLTVETIQSSKEDLNIVTNNLSINSKKVALTEEVPVIIALEQTEYDNLVQTEQVSENVYYYTYSDEQKDGVVTNEQLEAYCLTSKVNELIQGLQSQINELKARINALETT